MSVFCVDLTGQSDGFSVHTNKKDPHAAMIIFLFYLPTVSFDWQNRFREKIFVILFIIYSAFLFNISCWSCHSQIQIYPQPQSGNEIHQPPLCWLWNFDFWWVDHIFSWSMKHIHCIPRNLFWNQEREEFFISLKWK